MKRLLDLRKIRRLLKNCKVLGRGNTSVFVFSEKDGKYFLFTLDGLKAEYLQLAQIGKLIEVYDYLDDLNLYLLEVEKLEKVRRSDKDFKELDRELKQLKELLVIYNHINRSSEVFNKIVQYVQQLREKYEDNQYISNLFSLMENYGFSSIILDTGTPNNYLRDKEGKIIPYDIILSKRILEKLYEKNFS